MKPAVYAGAVTLGVALIVLAATGNAPPLHFVGLYLVAIGALLAIGVGE